MRWQDDESSHYRYFRTTKNSAMSNTRSSALAARQAASAVDQAETGESRVDPDQKRVRAWLGPIRVKGRNLEAPVVADVEAQHLAEIVRVKLQKRAQALPVAFVGGGDVDVHAARTPATFDGATSNASDDGSTLKSAYVKSPHVRSKRGLPSKRSELTENVL